MGRIVGIAALMGTLLLARPEVLWAGSTQAALAVSVVVPATCAVQVPGTVGAGGGVAMQCTKGAPPATRGSATAPGAVDPQITQSPVLVAESSGSHVVVTVNF